MSAPTQAARPNPSRPTRPVQRAAPGRPGSSRAGTPRVAAQRTPTSRADAVWTGASRAATAAGALTKAARSGSSRAGSSRAAASRAGTSGTGSSRAGSSRAGSARSGSTRVPAGGRGGPVTAGANALDARLEPAPRTRMRVLTRPDVAPRRIGFAVSCTALLGALMLGLLLLNVAISGNAFTVAELQSQRSLLVDQQQSLEQQLLVQSAPASLAARARAIGMVPAPQLIVLGADATGAPPLVPEP